MTCLLQMYLSTNELTGTVPEAWTNMATLRTLWLSHNEGINGTVPAVIKAASSNRVGTSICGCEYGSPNSC
ncbi:hypothetical protein FOA52_011636 [Chlamydomonas sp. UWO 241]|nr:hypothetical protein FOA52_011636 [Chlamydomonas sp. UWO 241]